MIVVLLFLLVVIFRWFGNSGENWKQIIDSDGRGYYAYLPAVFIQHNLAFDQFPASETESQSNIRSRNYLVDVGNARINKYFSGVALLLMPFFILAWIISLIAGLPADGYSIIFQISVSLAALFYFTLGLHFLRLVLKNFNFPKILIGVVILITVMGTNLLYYVLWNPSMSHVYSFAVISAFLYLSSAFFRTGATKMVFWMSVLLGLVTLIRATNILILFTLPFLAENFLNFKMRLIGLFRSFKMLLLLILPFLIVVSIQMGYWYSATGKLLIWSYQGEGFYFKSPETINFLFSFQKGWLIYTPIMILAICGLIVLFRRNIWQAVWGSIFLFSIVYLSSSWWNWYYGDGFGQRVMIDFYPFMGVLIAYAVYFASQHSLKLVSKILISILVFLNLFQTWQYINRIIHPYAMTFDKYAMVFLKPDLSYSGIFGGGINIPPYKTDMGNILQLYTHDFEAEAFRWNESGVVMAPGKAFSGNHAVYFDSANHYSSAFILKNEEIFYNRNDLFARVEIMVYDLDFEMARDAVLVYQYHNCFGELLSWDAYLLNDLPPKYPYIWRKAVFGFQIPGLQPGDALSIYIWNKGTGRFLIDDFCVEIYGRGVVL